MCTCMHPSTSGHASRTAEARRRVTRAPTLPIIDKAPGQPAHAGSPRIGAGPTRSRRRRGLFEGASSTRVEGRSASAVVFYVGRTRATLFGRPRHVDCRKTHSSAADRRATGARERVCPCGSRRGRPASSAARVTRALPRSGPPTRQLAPAPVYPARYLHHNTTVLIRAGVP